MQPLIVVAEYDRADELVNPLKSIYRVQPVRSADEAVEWCHRCPVDLVITRVVFREGMTGVELIEELAPLQPRPKAVLITPFRLEVLEKNIPGFPPTGIPIIRRPLPAHELLEQVAAILNGPHLP